MTDHTPTFSPDAEPLKIGMVLYPGFTLLDLAGPQAALGMNGRTILLWKTLEPVATDSGVALCPTTTFDDCPEDLDVLFVPGGFGTNDAMRDADVIGFLSRIGPRSRYVTSVCSGSLVLGMAGLLDGYRAADALGLLSGLWRRWAPSPRTSGWWPTGTAAPVAG